MTPEQITEFLGTRYWIQVTRDASTSWQYVAYIGLQNLTAEPRVLGREQVIFAHDDPMQAIAGAITEMKQLEAGR